MEYNIIGDILSPTTYYSQRVARSQTKMEKLPINLQIRAAEELEKAIAKELSAADGDLEKILAESTDEEEEETQDNTSPDE